MRANGITVVRDQAEFFRNPHNRDKRITLKAKGLLGLVLDLPASWEFSIRGLASICKEGKDAVGAAINELVDFGYCELSQVREGGKFAGYHYTFYQSSQKPDFLPYPGKPDTDKPDTENPPQYKGIIKKIADNKGGGDTPAKSSLPAPVLLWLEIIKLDISKEGAELIAKKISVLECWRDTLEGWVANPNWNKLNIDGQINRYNKKLRENDYNLDPVVMDAPTEEVSPEQAKKDEELRRLIYE